VTQCFSLPHPARWCPGRLSPPLLSRLTLALTRLHAVPPDGIMWPWIKAAVCVYGVYQPNVRR
jgi:hypothetical protein